MTDLLFEEGARVRLRSDEDRYLHFIAAKGSVGTITHMDDEVVCVKLDALLKGAESWDNEVHFYRGQIVGDERTAVEYARDSLEVIA
jgi:hypothetical protein